MVTVTLAFLAAATVSAVLTPLVRNAANRWLLRDHAISPRSVHTSPTPRLGGVAIVASFLLTLLGLMLADPVFGRAFQQERVLAVGLLAGSLAIAALGVYDDLRGAGARLKLTVQFGVAAAMYLAGFRIDEITSPWGGSLALGWLGLPLTVLWIAGVVNAVNLIDGLDGLAGGVALFAVATNLVTAQLQGDTLMLAVSTAMAGAVLGFLRYNFNPATIFMGDTGSMFLGFVLAVTAINTHQKTSAVVAIAVPVIALGVPIADMLLAIGRRAVRGAPLFTADRGHIHHRIMARGLSHRQAVLVLYASAAVLAGVALSLRLVNSTQGFLLLLALAVVVWVGLRSLGFLDLARTGEVLAGRRRLLDMRAAVARTAAQLRRAQTLLELWTAVRDGAPGVGASAVGLDLDLESDRGAGSAEPGPWSVGFDRPGGELLRARFVLSSEPSGHGHLELGWADDRTKLDRETEIAVERLCDEVSAALDRLERHAARGA